MKGVALPRASPLPATTGDRAILYSPGALRKRRKRRPGTGRAVFYSSARVYAASSRRRATRGIAGGSPAESLQKSWETHRNPMLLFELSVLFLFRFVQRALF